MARLAAISLVATLLLPAAVALADVRAQPPQGWVTARRGAEAVEALATTWGARVVQTLHTPVADDFDETLTLLDVPTPLAGDSIADSADARRAVDGFAAALEGAEVVQATRVATDEGISIATGEVEVDSTVYHVAIGPSGPRHAVLVLTSTRAERSLYRPVFEQASRELTGLQPTVLPFDVQQLRLFGALGWVLATLAAYLIAIRASDRVGDHSNGSRRAALLLTLLAVLVGVGLGAWLQEEASGLRLVGSDPVSVAVEIGAYGLAGAAFALLAGRLMGRSRVVQSAPSAGVYAARAGTVPPVSSSKLYDDGGMSIIQVDLPNQPGQPDNGTPPEPTTPVANLAPAESGTDGASASSSTASASASLPSASRSRAELSAADLLLEELEAESRGVTPPPRPPPSDPGESGLSREELSAADMLIEELEAKVKGRRRPPPARKP